MSHIIIVIRRGLIQYHCTTLIDIETNRAEMNYGYLFIKKNDNNSSLDDCIQVNKKFMQGSIAMKNIHA